MEPIAKIKRRSRRGAYDPEPLRERVKELLTQRKESMRGAALASGLDHGYLQRIINLKQRPKIEALILLADHFEINPNELLTLAGYPALKVFDIRTESAENLPPEAVEVALALARIPNPGERKQVAEAVMTLLQKYFG